MKTIGLLNANRAEQPLFDWLADVFDVRFEFRPAGRWVGLDAVICLGQREGLPDLPSLTMSGQVEESREPGTAQVQFGKADAVPKIFRGRQVEQEELGLVAPLQLEEGDDILATISGTPVWTRRRNGGCRTDAVGLSLPKYDPARSLFHYFEGFNFFRLLPLIEFLRRVTGQDQRSSPLLQACFMFDDPNLHSASYGWLDFGKLAAHASAHRYHVAMATVPLDAWRTNRKALEIYRDNKERLSLLVHGNDHLQNELALFDSEETALRSLAQALRRVAKLERNYSIEVSRVMAAPHGACSENSLRSMARLGFEAATLSCGAFCKSNPHQAWSRQIGLRLADVIGGLPTFGRFRFRYGNRFALLAAYLSQPIIPYGHHEDVAGGLDELENLAQFINSLGEVRWTNMGEICRSNYLLSKDGAVLRVHSYSRNFCVAIPEDCTEAAVGRPWVDGQAEGLRIRIAGETDRVFRPYDGEPFPVKSGKMLDAKFLHPQDIGPESVAQPNRNIWAFARRQLCEARDRLSPLVAAKNRKN